MMLITAEQRARLLANGAASPLTDDFDPRPVVKLFTPDARCTWLLTEIDPGDPTIAFGLCDLGLGCPATRARAASGGANAAVEDSSNAAIAGDFPELNFLDDGHR